MSAPFSSLFLDPLEWDLVADASGNIALCTPPYALEQDVACCCRTFYGEVYYDDTLGVKFLQQIFGKAPGLNVLQGAFAEQALTVPTVASAACVVSSFSGRQANGQVQFETESGDELAVAIA